LQIGKNSGIFREYKKLQEYSIMLTFLITYCGVGVIAGFLAGLLGIGGGLVIVPMLVYVMGTLTNHAPIQYFNLRVEFDLFDKTGTNKVGHTTDYVGNLGPTSAWTFKALVMEENATEAKLEKVMGEADTAAAAKDGKGAGAK